MAATAAVTATVGAGCGGGTDARSLRADARAAVPSGSRILSTEDGACVELADFPSCVTVWFDGRRRPLEERVRRASETARGEGWKSTGTNVARGGTRLTFRRDGLTMWVVLWSPLHAYFCKGRPAKDCADQLQVVRGA